MNYASAIQYVHSLEKFGIKPGLERISALCRAFGDPQDALKFIHIAGTNGKGSTATMLSRVFRQAGCKTGLFISPYVVDFCERIQVNNEMIPRDMLADAVTRLKPVAESMSESPTEFEFITAAAFLYFKETTCDIVVLETGLGGRLDSTNVIKTPLASVITSISLDHMNVLGGTIAEIAAEKCGIIKPGGITVSYPGQQPGALEVIKKTAADKNNRLLIPGADYAEIIAEDIGKTRAVVGGIPMEIPFMGRHMVLNAATAVMAARAVADDARNGFTVSDEAIARGVASAKMPARMEVVSENPLVIIDGGHNEGCAFALKNVIKRHLSGRRIAAVCGMMADKDYRRYLEITAPLFDKLIAAAPDMARALPARELARVASEFCSDVQAVGSAEHALRLARDAAGEDGAVIVCGSFYLAGECLPLLKSCAKYVNL
ncbi:MAG: bifunctional folylpolyglutamate synthase/dihydrofolate synthase [Oscillospiraceae bacterium]|nr:bifunctional folylpolyglutamate synthase/dihydrofolate synthase [Oscillospiraceae bacterium]